MSLLVKVEQSAFPNPSCAMVILGMVVLIIRTYLIHSVTIAPMTTSSCVREVVLAIASMWSISATVLL